MVGDALKILILIACCLASRAEAMIEGRVLLDQIPQPARGGLSPLKAVVLYLEGDFPQGTNTAVAKLMQRKAHFDPAILTVQVGTRVEFRNCDSLVHELFSFSSPKRFELGPCRPNDPIVRSAVFDKPGLVTVRCALHDDLRGFILAVPTPYFTCAAADGAYRLPNLPPGQYTLKVCINGKAALQKPVNLRDDDAVLNVNFP